MTHVEEAARVRARIRQRNTALQELQNQAADPTDLHSLTGLVCSLIAEDLRQPLMALPAMDPLPRQLPPPLIEEPRQPRGSWPSKPSPPPTPGPPASDGGGVAEPPLPVPSSSCVGPHTPVLPHEGLQASAATAARLKTKGVPQQSESMPPVQNANLSAQPASMHLSHPTEPVAAKLAHVASRLEHVTTMLLSHGTRGQQMTCSQSHPYAETKACQAGNQGQQMTCSQSNPYAETKACQAGNDLQGQRELVSASSTAFETHACQTDEQPEQRVSKGTGFPLHSEVVGEQGEGAVTSSIPKSIERASSRRRKTAANGRPPRAVLARPKGDTSSAPPNVVSTLPSAPHDLHFSAGEIYWSSDGETWSIPHDRPSPEAFASMRHHARYQSNATSDNGVGSAGELALDSSLSEGEIRLNSRSEGELI